MNGIAYLDTFSPSTTERSVEKQLAYITGYLYNLSEQVRFDLSNLGPENFNETSLQEMLAPLVARIEALEARVSALEGE